MKAPHLKFVLIVLVFCIPVACSAVTINPYPTTDTGYSWDGPSELHVTAPGSYDFETNDQKIIVYVDSSGVTLDGRNISILRIEGKPDLKLDHITIDVSDPAHRGYVISDCEDISNSSISVRSREELIGIGTLYGKIDDTTIIELLGSSTTYGIETVSSSGVISGGTFTISSTGNVYGIHTVDGTISGGTFTISGQGGYTYGVHTVDGTISGGTFTVLGQEYVYGIKKIAGGGVVSNNVTFDLLLQSSSSGRALGVDTVDGILSGGAFTVTSSHDAYGVYTLKGTISGGTFTVTSFGNEHIAIGIESADDNSKVSGGTFTITSQYDAAWIGGFDSSYNGLRGNAVVSGGRFFVNGRNNAYAIYRFHDSNAKISGGEFWAKSAENAYGIGTLGSAIFLDVALTGGTIINVWGSTEETTNNIGHERRLTGGTPFPCYEFTYPVDGDRYVKNANQYSISGKPIFWEYYESSVSCPPPT